MEPKWGVLEKPIPQETSLRVACYSSKKTVLVLIYAKVSVLVPLRGLERTLKVSLEELIFIQF